MSPLIFREPSRQVPSEFQSLGTIPKQGQIPESRSEILGKTIYLLVGCPGSGKTWVAGQLDDLFHLVHHDLFIQMTGQAYIQAIMISAQNSKKPMLAEAPFSISRTKEPLESVGFKVVPVVIQEDHQVISQRYLQRENKPIPQGHLTRQLTYADRAKLNGWFTGTTVQVLNHLREVARILSQEDPKRSQ